MTKAYIMKTIDGPFSIFLTNNGKDILIVALICKCKCYVCLHDIMTGLSAGLQ